MEQGFGFSKIGVHPPRPLSNHRVLHAVLVYAENWEDAPVSSHYELAPVSSDNKNSYHLKWCSWCIDFRFLDQTPVRFAHLRRSTPPCFASQMAGRLGLREDAEIILMESLCINKKGSFKDMTCDKDSFETEFYSTDQHFEPQIISYFMFLMLSLGDNVTIGVGG